MSERVKGATSISLLFRLVDSTTGAAKSGIDVTTLKLQYVRPGTTDGTATSLTLLSSVTAAWASYGAIEVDSTNSKGIYRIDCPNLAFATGADEVSLTVTGTGIEPCTRLIDLTLFDSRDGVRAGLTALPNAAAGATGGIPLTTGGGSGSRTIVGNFSFGPYTTQLSLVNPSTPVSGVVVDLYQSGSAEPATGAGVYTANTNSQGLVTIAFNQTVTNTWIVRATYSAGTFYTGSPIVIKRDILNI